MQKYNFHLDQKITTWMRTDFEVEASTYEEAVEKAKEMYKSGELIELPWEEIEGVQEIMDVDHNGGLPTGELYDFRSNNILDNTQF